MSSTSSESTLPSPAEIENLGVLFIGFVAATVLYGLTFFQTYIYYTRYPRDHQWIRYFVATLCILDTTASALISEVLYYYLIFMFDVNLDVLYATVTFCVQYLLSVLLTFMSHLFFAHRVFQVTGGCKPVTLVLVLLSFIALVFGLSASGQMFAQRRLSAFGSLQMEITAAASQATGVIADIIVFATMCYSLRPARYPDMVAPDGCVQTVVTVFAGRGLAFTVVQVAYFCVVGTSLFSKDRVLTASKFIAAPSKPFWIPLQMVACKVYVNTLLGNLNMREVKRGRGLNEENSLNDRKPSANAQFSNSIRLNVPDVKSKPQSVNFTVTRPGDSESERTDIESRKTYQDDRGNQYTQVSSGSGSTQSQTDNEANKEILSEPLN